MVSCIYFTILPIYLCTLRSEGNKILLLYIYYYYIIYMYNEISFVAIMLYT